MGHPNEVKKFTSKSIFPRAIINEPKESEVNKNYQKVRFAYLENLTKYVI